MKLLKTATLLSLLICSILCAEWSPGILLQEHRKSSQELSEPIYAELKEQILKELENSWCSKEKANLLMDLVLIVQPKVSVEIGAFTGSSVLPIAAAHKYLNSGKVFAIDAWSNSDAIQYLADNDPNKNWWAHLDMASVHQSFRHLIRKWELENFCTEIAKPSNRAIDDLPMEIDFLHLDGDYSEKGSLQDVMLYLPRVKSGGYILLSNLYTMIHREQPKIKSFIALLEECEIVTSIERDHAILFKKN